jgi:CMP-N-acetylneuraminic acid synthetase/3-deoxy-D-manno-octulosonate 8-phosphate phosphatase KdsC-like HAD superfamily phosphatase
MRCTAIIPARGGSRGIPRKNLLPVGGVPLVVRSIRAALQARHVTEVVVSTDDAEIARVSVAAGARVIERPADLAGDTASSESALLHALDVLATDPAGEPSLLVFLQCTSPLTTADDIDATIDALRNEAADCALSVTPTHHFAWGPGPAGAQGIGHDPAVRLRRQDLPPRWLETGSVYVMRTAGFRAARHRFFGRIAVSVLPAERAWEIDDPHDVLIVEALLSGARRDAARAMLPHPPSALVVDLEGVLTDGTLVLDDDGGAPSVRCAAADLSALRAWRAEGLPVSVLARSGTPGARAVVDMTGVTVRDAAATTEWLASLGADGAGVVHLCAQLSPFLSPGVGVRVAVAGASTAVRSAATVALSSSGGAGAVAELRALLDAAPPRSELQ